MTAREIVIANAVAKHLSPGAQLLEIGAGKGLVAKALGEMTGAALTLVDVVDYNRTPLPLQIYDGKTLPFEDGSFDRSLLIFVLHHDPDPLAVLREALRVSRGGVIVVENDVRGWLKRRLTRVIDSIPHYQYGVPVCHHTKSAEEWLSLFQTVTFRVEILERFSIDYFWRNVVIRVGG